MISKYHSQFVDINNSFVVKINTFVKGWKLLIIVSLYMGKNKLIKKSSS